MPINPQHSFYPSSPPDLPFPFLSSPLPPCRKVALIQLGNLGKCIKLPQRVPGQSPSHKCILGTFRLHEMCLLATVFVPFMWIKML